MMKHKRFGSYVELYVFSPKHGEHIIYVDFEDWCKMKEKRWWVIKSGRTFYAAGYNSETGHRGFRMHKLIMGIDGIDHIDSNGLNNRRSNLRASTHQQNMLNKKMYKTNKCGYKGIYFDHWDRNSAYRSAVKVNGKTLSGRRFKNPLLAAYQYNKMAAHYYGEFASLNKFTDEQMQEIMKHPKFSIANEIKKPT